MPYVATLDVVVNLLRFTNIDLLSQGMYYVAVSLRSRPEADEGVPGVPGKPYTYHERAPKRGADQWGGHAPGTKLDPDAHRLRSRGFYIRYTEEEENMRLRCGFSVSVDALRLFKQGGDDALIKFELYHLSKDQLEKDYGKSKPVYARERGGGRYEPYSPANIKAIAAAAAAGQPSVKVTQDGQAVEIDLAALKETSSDGHVRKVSASCATIPHRKFEVKSTREFPLKLAALPHTEWVPVMFDQWYYARMDTFITMVLSDIVYIPPPNPTAGPSSSKKRGDASAAFYATYGLTPAPAGEAGSGAVHDPVHEIDRLPTLLISYLTYSYYLVRAWMGGLSLRTELEEMLKQCEKATAARRAAAAAPEASASATQEPPATPLAMGDIDVALVDTLVYSPEVGGSDAGSPAAPAPPPAALAGAGDAPAGRPLELRQHHRLDTKGAKKQRKALLKNGGLAAGRRLGRYQTAWDKVAEGVRERRALVCHFRDSEASCVKDAEQAVEYSMYATKRVAADWVGLHDTSHNGLQTALSVLSENLQTLWQHVQATYAMHDDTWGGLNEVEASKSYFDAVEAYCSTRLDPPPASRRPSPYTPLYYTYDAHTEVTLRELKPAGDDGPVVNKAGGGAEDAAAGAAAADSALAAAAFGGGVAPSLVVFVHGWKGNSCDLAIFKNYLHLYIHNASPGTEFLCVRSMEDHPNKSIKELGGLVAAEVSGYIQEHQGGQVARVSFVGHSMGCLVVRAALQAEMFRPYLPHLHTFLSLTGPHLGVPVHERGAIGCAFGFISSVQRSQNIREMRLDAPFLHSLSSTDFIGQFKHVLFFGSELDQFVAPSSALVQPDLSGLALPAGKAPMVHDMARNITAASSRCATCRRFVVHFAPHARKELTSRFDRVVGKDVHISFLVDANFLNITVNLFKGYLT
eukprot:TRINITY_DN29887_c0_g1_i1.p2 TRINITY_DN29887_c0_g1~~TRINITY_DN29887_c0_g1_i1.p2  ORF type:complete len:917 (+),score=363.52 TRINITY_DN29887_c0_g1_i1:198-2948(+)